VRSAASLASRSYVGGAVLVYGGLGQIQLLERLFEEQAAVLHPLAGGGGIGGEPGRRLVEFLTETGGTGVLDQSLDPLLRLLI
jgi:hypothetical protein